MLDATFMAPSVTEAELLPIKDLHCRNRIFNLFCYCDFDPMNFIYKHDRYLLETDPENWVFPLTWMVTFATARTLPSSAVMYQLCEDDLPMSRLSKVIILQTNRQTDALQIIYHASGAGGQRKLICPRSAGTCAFIKRSQPKYTSNLNTENYDTHHFGLLDFRTLRSWRLHFGGSFGEQLVKFCSVKVRLFQIFPQIFTGTVNTYTKMLLLVTTISVRLQ